MSFNLRNIREISNDPLSKFTNEIAKKLSAFLTKDSIDQLDDNEDIYSNGQDIDTAIKFHDDLEATNKFTESANYYYPPFEPDGDKLKLWIRGQNIGSRFVDYSSFGRTTAIFGDPSLINGTPFDLGIYNNGGIKSLAVKFNRPASDYVNEEYATITHTNDVRAVEGLSTGISFFMRFRIHDLATQNGATRTLFQKIDNSTPNDGICVKVDPTGKIVVIVKRAGTDYKKETTTGTITTNTVYDMWVTYTVSGNVIHVYLNNVDKTLSANTDTTNFQTDLTNFNWYLFRRGAGVVGGYVYGDLYDFRIYREEIVSVAEVGYFNTNKWTIADIGFGQVMVANYFAPPVEVTPATIPSFTAASFSFSFTEITPSSTSFTSASFTSTSFTV